MPRAKPVLACDCETDPFKSERVPKPFIWGLYDGRNYQTFDTTQDFVAAVIKRDCILYAHNGGKFDFMFLLPFIKETKAQIINGRIVSMMLGACELRDSFSIIPVALKEFGFKKEIEHWKLEKHVRHKYKEEIDAYLFQDCKGLYDGVTRYRMVAGKHKTIASNAMAFAKSLGIDPGKTNHRFDTKYRRFFFGGRCECFQPGTHHNIKLLDIRSAYPYAMLQDHATGSTFINLDSLDGMTREEIQRSFIILECTSKGAFPIRTKTGLIFPHEYNEFYVTGWEYLVAKKFNLIENETIMSVRSTTNTINFKAYVDHWYEYKASHNKKTDPVNYTIGKIMMNSLYGKLAQNPARYYDYKIVLAGTEVDTEQGWELKLEFEGHEIHRRESLWKYKYELGVQWEAKGIYNNVATGASITGFTRAHLLHAMHTIGIANIIYCDTDGICARGNTSLSGLSFTDKIGDWELEDTAPTGHFAGKKLYAMKLSTGKYKLATKGSKLNQIEVMKHIDGEDITYLEHNDEAGYDKLVRLIAGETIRWDNPAPTFSIDGSAQFLHREIRATGMKTRNKERN